jgi:hypothetical protein
MVRWIVVLAVAGCNREPLPGKPDLLTPEGDQAMSVLDMASPTDAPMCPRYALDDLLITSLSLVDGEANLYGGAAIRLLAHTFWNGCTVPGDGQMTIHPGNATDGIDLRVRAWTRAAVGMVDCDHPINSLYVFAADTRDGLTSPMVIARDGAAMGNQTLMFKVAPQPMGTNCNASISLGNPCQLDCECQNADTSARCIPVAPGKGICALSCSEDVDCPPALPHCNYTGSPLFTCDKARPKPNCEEFFAFSSSFCKPGQVCTMANLCAPKMQVLSKACTCHPDCWDGAICTEKGECRIPCNSVRDCPAGAMACTGAVCE